MALRGNGGIAALDLGAGFDVEDLVVPQFLKERYNRSYFLELQIHRFPVHLQKQLWLVSLKRFPSTLQYC